MQHPWIILGNTIKEQGRTQKKFAFLVWKKGSELNELIKGKRNITIQRDYLLHKTLHTPMKHWLNLQIEYDYQQLLASQSEKQNTTSSNNTSRSSWINTLNSKHIEWKNTEWVDVEELNFAPSLPISEETGPTHSESEGQEQNPQEESLEIEISEKNPSLPEDKEVITEISSNTDTVSDDLPTEEPKNSEESSSTKEENLQSTLELTIKKEKEKIFRDF